MRRTNKKGFTIVELVIVIAVVAILAAVLIPTFASLVEKANQSADIQAVKEMNTQLAIAEVDASIDTVGDAINALKKVNINMENYTPLRADTQFYWVKSLNRVIYVDISGATPSVIFPTEYKTMTQEKGQWYALNGKIEYEDYSENISEDGQTLNVSSAGQFAKFVNDFNAQTSKTGAKAVTKIVLENDIDLAGATCKFTLSPDVGKNQYGYGLAGNSLGSNAVNIEIDGKNHIIYGCRDDNAEFNLTGNSYGYGLFSVIGYCDTVTIKNITFSGMHIEDTQADDSRAQGLIAGYLFGSLTLENVAFDNCSVVGTSHIGSIIGQVAGDNPSLTMNNVDVKSTMLSGWWGVAKAVGDVTVPGFTMTADQDCDFSGIKVVDRDGRGTITKSQITNVNAKKKDGTWSETNSLDKMKGDAGNTYMLSDNYLWPCVTNDWAWYHTGNYQTKTTNSGEATHEWFCFTDAKVTVEGQQYSFALNCDSISGSFTDGGYFDLLSEGSD